MFTGIVTDVGEVAEISGKERTLKRLRLHSRYPAESIALGASIACAGPCLTVVARGERPGGSWFEVEVAAETLALTTLDEWKTGTKVNLERSLKIGDELGGHLVTGHVDATALIIAREEITGTDDSFGATARFLVEVPADTGAFIARKGSVALDGVSLTVNSIDKTAFSVLLIPHSLNATTFGQRKAGDRLNLEVDLMARYAARLADARLAEARLAEARLAEARLAEAKPGR